MKDYVKENIVFLEEDYIISLAQEHLLMNNVVRGIEKEAFGGWISQDDSICINYTFYDEKLRCMALFLPEKYSLKELSQIIFYFAMAVSEINNENIIDMHNGYCVILRSLYERGGCLTFTKQEINNLSTSNPHGILMAKEPINIVPTIDKKSFYINFFKDITYDDVLDSDKVYLMYDFHTNQTKIGYSKNPKIREHTLQSEKPEIVLLTYWVADKQFEKELHKKYARKRVRGEWFNLNFFDYKEIKEYMKCGKY